MNDAGERSPNLGAGFSSVDSQPEPDRMVAAMDATATWPAVRQLRAWERDHLGLEPGERVLDLGCGTGDVSVALAADVSPGGSVLGVDACDAMLEAAQRRAEAAGVEVGFRRGDALSIGEPDGSFDACRAERTLQWVDDVEGAVAELVRVLRPGGRLSLIDTDWRTLAFDLPDEEATSAMVQAMVAVRGSSMAVGGRLLNLCREAGLADIDGVCATHTWTFWDPDSAPGPAGMFPFRGMVDQLVNTGVLDREMGDRFAEQALEAARRDRFYMSLSLVAVMGRRVSA
jgi:SAM-dependent methyltransferase